MRLSPRLLGPFAVAASSAIRLMGHATRLKFQFEDPLSNPHITDTPGLYLMWHETMLLPIFAFRDMGVTVLASRHSDGEMITRVLARLGYGAARGSSTRHGFTALRDLIRQSKIGHLAITPDGPRGPRRVVQAGSIYLASKTGLTISPVGCHFNWCWRANSWDRMVVPKPFTKGMCVIGAPIHIPPDVSSAELEMHRQHVQKEMDRIQARAEASIEPIPSVAQLAPT